MYKTVVAVEDEAEDTNRPITHFVGAAEKTLDGALWVFPAAPQPAAFAGQRRYFRGFSTLRGDERAGLSRFMPACF